MRPLARQVPAAVTFGAMVALALVITDCVPQYLEPYFVYSEDPGLRDLPTTDPAATRAYLSGLTFSSTPSVSTITCDTGGPTTLHIFPEVRSHHLNPAHARMRGRIVARVKNVGTRGCSDLHLGPGEVAYWWMGPYRPDTLSTHFWRIPASPADTIRHLANTAATRTYAMTQRERWEAVITDRPLHGGNDDRDGDGGGVVRFGHNSTWIACLGGCCESTSLVEAFF